MKLSTLGVTLVALLAGGALVFLLCLSSLASQFELTLQSFEKSSSGLVLPLRQIDANTKNLRFHLLASYMHNGQSPVAALHNHPTSLHLNAIETEIRNNQALWIELASRARNEPKIDLNQLRLRYEAFFRHCITPSLRAARTEDWAGIIRPITTTLPDYLAFEASLQDQITSMRQLEQQRYQRVLLWRHRLIGVLFVLILCVVSAATWLVWHAISRHSARLLDLNRSLMEANQGLEDKVARRTAELERANGDMTLLVANLRANQEQLVQSEKLAGLGSLVAGVAHELNTPIGNGLLAVTTLSDMATALQAALDGKLRRSYLLEHASMTRRCCELLERSLHKAGELIASFKLVAAEQDNDRRMQFELSRILGRVLDERRDDLQRARCAVHFQLPNEVVLDSYPDSLARVMHSLIDNALLHAFDGLADSRIDIVVHETGQQRVVITFFDNGAGMPLPVLQRVFEPFFTTKMGRGGGGLGMTIVHNTVTAILGGQITVSPALPRGTRVDLSLPRLAPVRASQERQQSPQELPLLNAAFV